MNPVRFFREVRQEVRKVTWPTRRETVVTTVMVFIMAALCALFFFAADQVISLVIKTILGFGN